MEYKFNLGNDKKEHLFYFIFLLHCKENIFNWLINEIK